MGTSCDDDVMLFEEKDDRLWMHTSKTDSERFLIMTVGGKIMNESHLIDLQGAKGAEDHASRSLVLIEPRSEENGGHRYSVEHQGDHLYIITNKDGSLNSKLTKTSGELKTILAEGTWVILDVHFSPLPQSQFQLHTHPYHYYSQSITGK